MKRITIIAILVTFVSTSVSAQNHTYRRRGALLGGLAGAALGVAIGDKGNNETAGALIGGVAGAFAGGALGNQHDRRIEHNRRYHSGYHQSPYHTQYHQGQHYGHTGYPNYHQPYYYPQQTEVRPTPAPVVVSAAPVVVSADPVITAEDAIRPQPQQHTQTVTRHDVMTMVNNGMSESLIVQQIELHGFSEKLSVADVIKLHELGVSEGIITAMQIGKTTVVDNDMPSAPGVSYSKLTSEKEPPAPSILVPSNSPQGINPPGN